MAVFVLVGKKYFIGDNLFMILLFTGNGKGKTTAALGQAVRALGQNKKVLMVQFIKGPWVSGEDNFVSTAAAHVNFEIVKTGKGFVKILGDSLPFEVHKQAAQNGLALARQAINSKKYDLIILDEINNAVDLKLVSAEEVLDSLNNLPDGKDVILTGRNAPKSFAEIADIVTEMKEIKHGFNDKKPAKKGMEY